MATKVELIRDFPYPVEKLYNFLSVHKNLETIFAPAKIRRIKDGEDVLDGLGSVRKMSLPLLPSFEETVTVREPNERIEYKITRGTPLRNHHGVMRFLPSDKGVRLHYTITFSSRVPLLAPAVGLVLKQGINRGLKKIRL